MSERWGSLAIWALLLAPVSSLEIARERVFQADDLFSYVTMPNVRAPRFNVTVNSPEKVSPGYWFVAPYTSVDPWHPIEDYKPYQIGPMIYDGNGELVWTGAHLFQDRSVFDFRSTQVNGTPHLSFMVNYDKQTFLAGSAIVLDPSYHIYQEIALPEDTFNMHEFNVVDDGKSALIVTSKAAFTSDMRDVINDGFEEVDLASGRKLFEWNSIDHIDVRASHTFSWKAWDYVHLNSVDKSKVNGDYIISSRYTDTIYRLSAKDGSVVWKLGGTWSDFLIPPEMDFLAQHDARILEEHDSTITLSFLNNGGDDTRSIRPYSSGFIVRLDTSAMTAELLHSYDRPDNQSTRGRGNIQLLPNHNVFANWADNAFISEHTPDGELVWQAQFVSKRYVTYRAYKFEFEGAPITRPALSARATATADGRLATSFHVSWNGATRVRTWRFHACVDDGCDRTEPIGTSPRKGFETEFVGAGLHPTVFAEAFDAEGNSLGRSEVVDVAMSVLPALEEEGDGHGRYGVTVAQVLLVSVSASAVAVFWVLCCRRKRRRSLVGWGDPEKLALRDDY